MVFKTILVEEKSHIIQVTFNRIERDNSIDSLFLQEINTVLDSLNKETQKRILLFKGSQEFFCTGLDFHEISTYEGKEQFQEWAKLYTSTLRRLTESHFLIASVVEGKVLAGGMGLIGASDWVISTENASFKLTEALWGLIPAMVAPYLLRRISFQQLRSMALTCRSLSAKEAKEIQLIDEMNPDVEKALNQLIYRTGRIDPMAIKRIKHFFNAIAPISSSLEQMTISEFVTGISSEQTLSHIHRYLDQGILPWNREEEV